MENNDTSDQDMMSPYLLFREFLDFRETLVFYILLNFYSVLFYRLVFLLLFCYYSTYDVFHIFQYVIYFCLLLFMLLCRVRFEKFFDTEGMIDCMGKSMQPAPQGALSWLKKNVPLDM